MTAQQVFRGTLIVLMTLVAAYVLAISARILVVLLVALIIASALRPLVVRMRRLHIPLGAAIVSVYGVLLALMLVISIAILPPIVNQVAQYIENDSRLAYRIIMAQRWAEGFISGVMDEEVSLVAEDEIRDTVRTLVAQFRDTMPSILDNLGGTLGDAVLVFIMGAYWLTSHQKATEFLTRLSPPSYRQKTQQVIDEIEDTLGSFVRGIVAIASIVGLANMAAFSLLGVPNALTLGFIVGVATCIPMIGGLIGGIIITLMTLIAAPQFMLQVFVPFIIIQQIENYFLTPRIMSGRVGLDPLLVILYTSIGFVTSGIVGGLVAVPVMGTLHILLQHLVIEPYQLAIQSFQMEKGINIAKPGQMSDKPVQIIRSSHQPEQL